MSEPIRLLPDRCNPLCFAFRKKLEEEQEASPLK
jgi:hypothetical protein